MARILITGGAGFIGSHLVEYLLRRDHEILCLDNYFTGSKVNLLHLRDHPRLEMLRHDVVNPIMLEVDQVYHLACPASPVHYQYNPVKTIKTNVMGTLNMLGQQARAQKVSPCVVFHDSHLRAIAAHRPVTLPALSGLKGIGPRKLAKYGTMVIELVRQHLAVGILKGRGPTTDDLLVERRRERQREQAQEET